MKKENRLFFGIILCLLLAASACTTIYVPTAKHTHFLEEKGELDIAIYSGTNGVDVQGAYAITNELGVVAAISVADREGSADPEHRHFVVEAGADYFKKIGKFGRFEGLVGLGIGTAEAEDIYDFFGPLIVSAKGTYSNIFLQTNLDLETKIADIGIALRMNQIMFSKFKTSNVIYNEMEAGTFFEPSVFVRLGWNRLKVEYQMGYSAPLQNNVGFLYEPFTFSLGIRYNFDLGK